MKIPQSMFNDIRIYDSLDLINYVDAIVLELDQRQLAADDYKRRVRIKMNQLKRGLKSRSK